MTPPSGQRAHARSRPPCGRTRRARRRGQALVELALILPVMLFLLLGALDLGRVFYANITVTSAAKEAALRASNGESDWAAAAVNEARGGFVTIASGDVSATFSDAFNQCSERTNAAAYGRTVTATVDAPFQAITPYIAAFLGGSTITLTGSSTALCTVLPVAAVPTPTGTPDPGPTPTPTPDPGPTPTPSPIPAPMCNVPNFNDVRKNDAAGLWTGAGFTGSITFQSGSGNYRIDFQSLSAGPAACTSSITVGP